LASFVLKQTIVVFGLYMYDGWSMIKGAFG